MTGGRGCGGIHCSIKGGRRAVCAWCHGHRVVDGYGHASWLGAGAWLHVGLLCIGLVGAWNIRLALHAVCVSGCQWRWVKTLGSTALSCFWYELLLLQLGTHRCVCWRCGCTLTWLWYQLWYQLWYRWYKGGRFRFRSIFCSKFAKT